MDGITVQPGVGEVAATGTLICRSSSCSSSSRNPSWRRWRRHRSSQSEGRDVSIWLITQQPGITGSVMTAITTSSSCGRRALHDPPSGVLSAPPWGTPSLTMRARAGPGNSMADALVLSKWTGLRKRPSGRFCCHRPTIAHASLPVSLVEERAGSAISCRLIHGRVWPTFERGFAMRLWKRTASGTRRKRGWTRCLSTGETLDL